MVDEHQSKYRAGYDSEYRQSPVVRFLRASSYTSISEAGYSIQAKGKVGVHLAYLQDSTGVVGAVRLCIRGVPLAAISTCVLNVNPRGETYDDFDRYRLDRHCIARVESRSESCGT